MKKLNKKILIFILFVFMCAKVDAATIKVNDGDAESSSEGNILKVEISGSDIEDYNGVSFGLSVSGGEVSVDSVSINNQVAGFYSKDGDIYSIENRDGNFSSSVVATIKYSTSENFKSDATVAPVEVKFYKSVKKNNSESNNDNDDYEKRDIKDGEVKTGTIKYVAPKSKDADLTELTVGTASKDFELSPAFDKDTLEYAVEVPDTINRVSINATAVKGASRTGTGSKTIELGENGPYEIVVTAEDGVTTKTYKVTIIRGEESKPSPYLKKLTINNIGAKLSPEFDKQNNKYTVILTNVITKLDIKYEKEDSNAKVEIEGNEKLNEGDSIIKITVTSSDNEEKQVYVLNVKNKKEESESKTVIATNDNENTPKKDNKLLIVVIAASIAIIVSTIGYFLFRKKNKTSEKKKSIDEILEESNKKEINASSEEVLEKTSTFNVNDFTTEVNNNLDKTKEFNFKDFE